MKSPFLPISFARGEPQEQRKADANTAVPQTLTNAKAIHLAVLRPSLFIIPSIVRGPTFLRQELLFPWFCNQAIVVLKNLGEAGVPD